MQTNKEKTETPTKVLDTEFKGTKGEWKVWENSVVTTTTGVAFQICEMNKHAFPEVNQANAKLISMAPELLYQLQTAVHHLKNIQEKYKPEIPFAIGEYELTIKRALS